MVLLWEKIRENTFNPNFFFMTSYKDSGVDVELGDQCSKIAYQHAKNTFQAREGLFGAPLRLAEGFFGGALDMGDFYMTQSEDTVGTKILVAHALQKWDTLAYDLLAMVLDDTICMGAEVVSIGNTVDTPQMNEGMIEGMMSGLEKACLEQHVVVLGGEIAESGNHLNFPTWGASALGLLEKSKLLDPIKVQAGDILLGLKSPGFRCNGISLVRHILEKKYGTNWAKEPYTQDIRWGDAILMPSVIYHNCLLEMLGRFGKERLVDIHGLAHITGGGIPSKLGRILRKNNLGADLSSLFEPDSSILKVQEIGEVSDEEAYKTWNMGTGMIIALPESEVQKARDIAAAHNIEASMVGQVTAEKGIILKSQGLQSNGDILKFAS